MRAWAWRVSDRACSSFSAVAWKIGPSSSALIWPASAFRCGDLASAAVDFSPYLRLEAKVNPDGSVRSVAVRDRSVTIDLSKVVHGDDALEFAVLPPTAALARNILGGATNPRLTAAEQAHLAAAVVGNDDPVALGSFGKTPVFATLDEKGVRYTFLTDVAGNLWYIAQAAG